MQSVLALATKDLRILLRDKAGAFFIFVFPVVYAIFFGLIFSGQGGGAADMRIVAADLDGTEASAQFIASLDARDGLAVSTVPSREEALDAVRRSAAVAAIILPPGYGSAAQNPFAGQAAPLELAVDPARSAEAGMIEGLVTATSFERIQTLFTDPGAMQHQVADSLAQIESDPDVSPQDRLILSSFLSSLDTFMTQSGQSESLAGGAQQAFNPVSIERIDVARDTDGRITNGFAITFPQAVTWGVIGAAAGFGVSLVQERTRGTLIRLRMSPARVHAILAGKALACFLTCLAVAVAVYLIARFVFDLRPNSHALLALAVLCVAFCFSGIMMCLACLGRTEASAGGVGWAIMLVFAMLGGAMVPLMMMPAWMQTAGSISPVKWAIYAMEGAVWRGFSPAEMATPCLILIAIGAVAFLVGARIFTGVQRA